MFTLASYLLFLCLFFGWLLFWPRSNKPDHSEVQQINLDRVNAILHELRDAGYSDKDLNEVELLVLMEMAANERAAKTHITCDN